MEKRGGLLCAHHGYSPVDQYDKPPQRDMTIPFEYVIFVPVIVIAAFRIIYYNEAVEVEYDDVAEYESSGHPSENRRSERCSNWCRRWKSRYTCSGRCFCIMFTDNIMFCFLLFYVLTMKAIEFYDPPEDQLQHEQNRREFIGRMFAIAFGFGTLIFLPAMEHAVTTVVSLVLITPLVRFVESEDIDKKVTDTLLTAGILIVVTLILIGTVCYFGSIIIAKFMLETFELLMIGFCLGLTAWAMANGWDYYLLKKGNNNDVYWTPIVTSVIIAAFAFFVKIYIMMLHERARLRAKYLNEQHGHGGSGTSAKATAKGLNDEDEDAEEEQQEEEEEESINGNSRMAERTSILPPPKKLQRMNVSRVRK